VSAVALRQLRQLDQDVAGCGRIDERDARAGMPDARRLVAELDALPFELGQRAVDVVDLEADGRSVIGRGENRPGDT